MMKRIAALVLCLLLAFSALCAAAAETEELAGVWYLSNVEMQGMSLVPSVLGLEVAMTLNADGAAVMASLGIAEAGTWSQDGDRVTVNTGNENIFTLVDGKLRSEADAATGMTLVFSRDPADAQAYAAAPVRTDAALGDFNGEWHAFMMEMLEVQMLMTGADSQLWFEIENGSGVMHSVEAGVEETAELEGSFADGLLTLGSMPLVLHEDGVMSYSEQAEEAFVTIYFRKAE